MTYLPPSRQCDSCRHFQGIATYNPEDAPALMHVAGFCAAFPEVPGIPAPIWRLEFDHRAAYPGDHDIRWEPKTPGTRHPMGGQETPSAGRVS